MGKMYKKQMLDFLAITSMFSEDLTNLKSFNLVREKTPEEIECKKREIIAKKGVKVFYYGEVPILARNKKNADRKALNKGLI